MRLIISLSLICFMSFPNPIFASSPAGEKASSTASGDGVMVIGKDPYDFEHTAPINGTITINVNNKGDRGSPLQNIDEVEVKAEFTTETGNYQVVIQEPMLSDPQGRNPTWFGVGYEKPMHGNTNTGTRKLPEVVPAIAIWGWADVYKDGELLKSRAPAHVKVMDTSRLSGIVLEVETDGASIPGTPNGYLNIHWPNTEKLVLPMENKKSRELAGWGLLIALNLWFGFLAIREKQIKK